MHQPSSGHDGARIASAADMISRRSWDSVGSHIQWIALDGARLIDSPFLKRIMLKHQLRRPTGRGSVRNFAKISRRGGYNVEMHRRSP